MTSQQRLSGNRGRCSYHHFQNIRPSQWEQRRQFPMEHCNQNDIHPLSNIPYAFDIMYFERSHKVGSYLRRSTCPVPISISVRSGSAQTVSNLLDTVVGPSLSNRLFLPHSWPDHIKLAVSATSWTETRLAVCIYSITLMFLRICDYLVRAWVVVIYNLSLHVHFSSSSIFASTAYSRVDKRVFWSCCPLWILSSLQTLS